MGMLTNEKIESCLKKYFDEHYIENEVEHWYEQPAVNVWVFTYDDKIVTLKCHILTGEVTAQTEDKTN